MGRAPIYAFVGALTEGQIADDTALDVLYDIRARNSLLADIFIASPAQFWKFVDVVGPILLGGEAAQ